MSDYVVVPREPTSGMHDAAWEASLGGSEPMHCDFPRVNGEIYRAMVSAAPSPWMPIEMAPKDGTDLLLLIDGSDRTVGNYYGKWSSHPWRVGEESYRADRVTHFMFLPDPPSSETGK